MNGRLLALAAILLCMPIGAIAAGDVMEGVRQRLEHGSLIRGDFQQTRRIAGFRNPLVSSGRFVLVPDRGVLWRTQKPFASTMIVTSDRLELRNSRGEIASQMDARNQPLLRAVNDTLMALLAADTAALAENFVIDATMIGESGWELRLVPRDTLLARQLRRVVLQGERFVSEVQLEEQEGDSTVIRFLNLSADGELQPDEAALLGGGR